jgi:hypothetical protein
MAYQAVCTLSTAGAATEAKILERMAEQFPYSETRKLVQPFASLICFTDLNNFEAHDLPDADIEEYGDAYTYLRLNMRDRVEDLSAMFPQDTFVYIEVDCFGGTCEYSGFVCTKGKKTSVESASQTAHVRLLQAIAPDYTSIYFEPFSRDYFRIKGRIKGEISGMSMAGLWLALKTDWPNYYKGASELMALLEEDGVFNLTFEVAADKIEVKGVTFDDDTKTIAKVQSLLEESLVGMGYHITMEFPEVQKKLELRNEK